MRTMIAAWEIVIIIHISMPPHIHISMRTATSTECFFVLFFLFYLGFGI